MEIQQFQGRSKEQQWEIFSNQGVYLMQMVEANHSYSLYAMHRFYVEVVFSLVEGKTLGINAFEFGSNLDRYLSWKVIIL